MKRPWAFVCAASTTKSETLRRYCRALYTLGYVPICPPIQDGQYLVLADPTERADYNDIVREKILRCPQIRPYRLQPAWLAGGGREGRTSPLLRPHRLAHYLLAGFASIAFGRPNACFGDAPNPVCRLAAIRICHWEVRSSANETIRSRCGSMNRNCAISTANPN